MPHLLAIIMFKYMFMFNICMPFKTITIKDYVYKELLKAKRESESFSSLFERLVKRGRPDIYKYFGGWKATAKEVKSVNAELARARKSLDEDFSKRLKHAGA